MSTEPGMPNGYLVWVGFEDARRIPYGARVIQEDYWSSGEFRHGTYHDCWHRAKAREPMTGTTARFSRVDGGPIQ